MADTQSPVTLNIGSQRLAMGTFSLGKGDKITLQKYATRSVLADPAMEMARMPQVFQSVSELAKEIGEPKARVYYALSGQSVFTRFAKLPMLDASNVKEIVGFEAQQQFPVALSELAWDFQLLPPTESGEQEVALIAMRKDALNEFYDTVKGVGLSTASIDVAPTMLFSAFKHAYPEVTGSSLIVDIGAKSTNLIYIEGDRMFLRTARFGGATITSAIAKTYNLSFADAEAQKTSNGLVGLAGGFGGQVSEEIAALAATIRTAFGKLPAEIARTTNRFRSQQGGSAPTQIFLAGGGANLAYTKEFFEEKLKLPVHFFNPLKNVTLSGQVDPDLASREAHMMGELIGLALKGGGSAKAVVDLVPDAVGKKRDISKRKPLLATAAVVFLAALGAWAGSKFLAANQAEEKAAEAIIETQNLSGPSGKIKKSAAKEKKINTLVNSYAAQQKSRTQWIKIYDKLAQTFAHDAVWMVDLEPVAAYNRKNSASLGKPPIKKALDQIKHGQSSVVKIEDIAFKVKNGKDLPKAINAVRITGFWRENSDSYRAVYNLLTKLREAPAPFKFEFDKKALTDGEVIKRIVTTQGPDEFGWPFEMVLPLENPIKLNQ